MNMHEIFETYKNKRETIFSVYLDLQEQCNEIRRQRDFAMTMIKFIDMKNAIDTPDGTYEEVVRLMDKKDDDIQKAFEAAQERTHVAAEKMKMIAEYNQKQREEGSDNYLI